MTGLVGFLCEWGEKAATEDDTEKCNKRAVGVVAVKDGRHVHAVKVCMAHRMVLMAETGPV